MLSIYFGTTQGVILGNATDIVYPAILGCGLFIDTDVFLIVDRHEPNASCLSVEDYNNLALPKSAEVVLFLPTFNKNAMLESMVCLIIKEKTECSFLKVVSV